MKPELSPTKKSRMYLCLLPVFGIIPSLLNLRNDRTSKELKDTSQVAVLLFLTWLISYATLGSTGQSGEGIQVSLELFKVTLSSTYFVTTIYLMYRLYKGKPLSLPWQKSRKHRDLD